MRQWHRLAVATSMLTAALVLDGRPATAAVVRATPASSWQTDGRVRAIVIAGGRIYLGGDFRHVRPPGARSGGAVRNHLAALDAGTGALLRWNPRTNGPVRALRITPGGGTIYVGGEFTAVGGHRRERIAAISTHGARVRHWHPRANGAVSAILARPRRVYIGGAFTAVNGRRRARVAAVSARAGAKLLRWHASIGGDDVRAMALSRPRNRLYVGGWFTHVNGRPHRHLAALGTSSGATRRFSPRPAWPVSKLLVAGRSVYAAGAGKGGQVASYNVRTGSRRWLSITDGDVVALALRRGVLYAGGHFLNYCRRRDGTGHPLVCTAPAARRHLLALNARTAHLTRWNPGTNSVHGVFALAASAAQVDAGGDFTLVDGTRHEGIARFRR